MDGQLTHESSWCPPDPGPRHGRVELGAVAQSVQDGASRGIPQPFQDMAQLPAGPRLPAGGGTQRFMEYGDLADHCFAGQPRQRQAGDAVRGEQQGIAAVPADVEHHDRPGDGLPEKFSRAGRLREKREALLRADLCHDGSQIACQPLPSVLGPVRAGGPALPRVASSEVRGQGLSELGIVVEQVTDADEARGQGGMPDAEIGEVSAEFKRPVEQDRPPGVAATALR